MAFCYYCGIMIKYDDSYKIRQGSKFAVSVKKFSNINAPVTHTMIHYHSDMELLFVEEGETIMQVAGHTFTAKKDSLILVNPYEVHSGITLGEKYAHSCICFDIQQLGLSETERFLSGDLAFSNHIPDADYLLPNFKNCFEAINNRTDGWDLKAKGNLMIMFSALTDKVTSTLTTKEQTFARSVLEFIEKSFSEKITSKEISENFSYDHSYFCRKFKKIFSQSFGNYLNGYRVSRAKEYLKSFSVSETALNCGFDNMSYFSRSFKSITGLTPSEYKKKFN